jgi:hypothetical protein
MEKSPAIAPPSQQSVWSSVLSVSPAGIKDAAPAKLRMTRKTNKEPPALLLRLSILPVNRSNSTSGLVGSSSWLAFSAIRLAGGADDKIAGSDLSKGLLEEIEGSGFSPAMVVFIG